MLFINTPTKAAYVSTILTSLTNQEFRYLPVFCVGSAA